MASEHENAYRRLPGPRDPTDGAPDALDMPVFDPAGSERRAGGAKQRPRPRTVAIRAALTFFIVCVVIPCLSLALGTMQCLVLTQWLPGGRQPGECLEQPSTCLLLGFTVSGISLGVHGFLWVLQLLWAHV